QVQAVHALVAVGKAAVVSDPAADAVAEVGGEAQVGAGPVGIGDETGQREAARHAGQAGANLACLGAVVVVPCHAQVRVQGAVGADFPVALELPAERADQRDALLAAEPHRRAVVAFLAVAIHAHALPLDARERAGAYRPGANPPAAVEAGHQLRTAGLAGLGTRQRAQLEATV